MFEDEASAEEAADCANSVLFSSHRESTSARRPTSRQTNESGRLFVQQGVGLCNQFHFLFPHGFGVVYTPLVVHKSTKHQIQVRCCFQQSAERQLDKVGFYLFSQSSENSIPFDPLRFSSQKRVNLLELFDK